MENIASDQRQQSSSLIPQFQLFTTTHISDAMGRTGCMRDIQPICRGTRMEGLAYTVQCAPNDNLMVHYAVKLAQPGDVLVIATGGHTGSAPLGELLVLSAKQRGLAGMVTDGCARDRAGIEEMRFPVYVRGITPQGTFKKCPGPVNKPISCAGVAVCNGDIIIGDDDGVVVVPWQMAEEVIRSAHTVLEKEKEMQQRVLAGEVLYDILKLTQ